MRQGGGSRGVPSMAQPREVAVEGWMAGDRSILRDVATAAGVSLRTASRVLNDDPRVAAVTRERVQRMMQDLQYKPDLMARSLRGGTDATVGLVVESIGDPFFAELVEAVEDAGSEHGR